MLRAATRPWPISSCTPEAGPPNARYPTFRHRVGRHLPPRDDGFQPQLSAAMTLTGAAEKYSNRVAQPLTRTTTSTRASQGQRPDAQHCRWFGVKRPTVSRPTSAELRARPLPN